MSFNNIFHFEASCWWCHVRKSVEKMMKVGSHYYCSAHCYNQHQKSKL